MSYRWLPLVALVAAACSTGGLETTTSPEPTSSVEISSTSTTGPAGTTPTTSSSTVTTEPPVPPESLIYDHWVGEFTYGESLRIDVHAPEVRSNHPIAVTVHGGGWYGGRLDSMGLLADGLAERGFVVFNATYRTLAHGGSFPSMVEDVACAVAYARDHALDYSTAADRVTLIGHSAGAHLGALVAFAPEIFGTACEGADAGVDVFVGLAGSYDTDLYAFLLEPFFGVPRVDDPELWSRGNPLTYVDGIAADLSVLLVHGEVDELVPVSMSEQLYLAVEATGVRTRLELLPTAGHGEVNSPVLVADMIHQFVLGDQ